MKTYSCSVDRVRYELYRFLDARRAGRRIFRLATCAFFTKELPHN